MTVLTERSICAMDASNIKALVPISGEGESGAHVLSSGSGRHSVARRPEGHQLFFAGLRNAGGILLQALTELAAAGLHACAKLAQVGLADSADFHELLAGELLSIGYGCKQRDGGNDEQAHAGLRFREEGADGPRHVGARSPSAFGAVGAEMK